MSRYKWTAEMDEILKTSYPHHSTAQVALQMGMSERSIDSRAYRLGLKKTETYRQALMQEHNRQLQLVNQRYGCDHSFFSCIGTREKAYWLGWLWSDGYLRVSENSYQIVLSLQKRDEGVLQQFKQALHAEYPLRLDRNAVTLCLISQPMFADLERCGVVRQKSKLATFPSIEQVFVADFIRGVFDSDGSIGITRQPVVTIIGTETFCYWLQQTVKPEPGIQSAVYRKKNSIFRWVLITQARIRLFAQWMIYRANEDGSLPVFLKRKYNKFVDASLV